VKTIWLLYHINDLNVNRDYVTTMRKSAKPLDLTIKTVTLDQLTLTMNENGMPGVLLKGKPARPDAVISRMRDPLYSRHLEAMGVPVFNGSKVCEICNDKRYTYQFLKGMPMPRTTFLTATTPMPTRYPQVVKPACSHGGDRVQEVKDILEYQDAVETVLPEAGLVQDKTSKPGYDLRVYVLFGKIVAGVMRHSKHGMVSNFKQGGEVSLHTLTREETDLCSEVIRRFEEAGAPLCFAGVDFLYEKEGPVIGEVEDVVGSRMLYKASDIDIVAMYLSEIARRI